jgi:hypothetical protein
MEVLGVGCSGPPFACALEFSGVWVLVGLLFEICIVDASIFHSRAASHVGGGWVVGEVCNFCVFASFACPACDCGWGVCVVLTLLRQAMKGTWWMPWHQEPMKDVGACDKPWGVGNRAVIRGCPEWGNLAGVMSSHLHLNI